MNKEKSWFVTLVLFFSFTVVVQSQTTEEISGKDRLILFDVYTDWCRPCKLMDKTTYSDSSVKAFIYTYFDFKKIDAEDKSNIKLVEEFGLNIFPTTLVVDKNYNQVSKHIGYIGPSVMLDFLEAALYTSENSMSPVNNKRKLGLKEYHIELRNQNRTDSISFKKYIQTLSEKEKLELENLYIISGYVNNCSDSLFKPILNALDLPIADSEYFHDIRSCYNVAINNCRSTAVKEKNKDLILKVIEFEKSRKNLINKESVEFQNLESFFRKTKDTVSYNKLISEHCENKLMYRDSVTIRNELIQEYKGIVERSGELDEISQEDYISFGLSTQINSLVFELNRFANYTLEKESTQAEQKQALLWVVKALSIKVHPEIYLTGAKLWFQLYGGIPQNYFSQKLKGSLVLENNYINFITSIDQ